MRIFYAVHHHYWENNNLLPGLRQAGHEVIPYDPGHAFHEALGPDWSESDQTRVSERLVDAVRAEHARKPLDLFFSYFLKQLVFPEAIRDIGRLGVITANYWCNGAHQFNLVDEISPAFDYCIVTERAALPAYKAVGANPVYLQMAANPDLYRPFDIPREYDVTFVGQRYADRPVYVLHLLKNGVDTHVWGPGWTADRTFGEQSVGTGVSLGHLLRHPRSSLYKLIRTGRNSIRQLQDVPLWDERRLSRAAGPSLPHEQLARMYSRSRISLGFSTCGDARYSDVNKIRQIHLRDFEATMSGACYFVEYQDELRDFYDIGREIICYNSREDLLDKVRYYLAHPAEACRVRAAGYARACSDHTWAHRFKHLFGEIGLSSGGHIVSSRVVQNGVPDGQGATS